MKNFLAAFSFLPSLMFANAAFAGLVTSPADSGPGSLRATIANAVPGETIFFAVSGAITLTSGELLIDKDLIISGPGAAILSVQRSAAAGTPAFRIFNVQSGIVAISGLTVNNGHADVGGGINNATTFTLRECVIGGNSASERGGGINNFSTLTMANCIIHDNSATGGTNDVVGGGINSQGTLVAMNCVVSSNFVAGVMPFGGFGGGILNNGTLAFTNSMIIGNAAIGGAESGGGGGGIDNEGTLTLHTTTVSYNSATGGPVTGGSGQGGGILNVFGTVTLDRSTVSGNSATGGNAIDAYFGGAAHGGGIANNFGTVTVENSTVSGNRVSGGVSARGPGMAFGGGIFNASGSVTLDHATIAANSVPAGIVESGGGFANVGGVVELKDTILAANIATLDFVNLLAGDFHSGGFNLIGSTNVPVPPGPSDQFNITATALRLGPLQDNGGPTFTHALLCGSPAIDAGDNTDAPATDQRGFPRIVRGVIDIGAFEDSNTPPTITCPGPLTNCASGGSQTATISANVTDADGDPLTVVWSVDGSAYQTNTVPAGGTPTSAHVQFTASFSLGAHQITVSVTDASDCTAICTTTFTVLRRGDLYPIALDRRNLAGVRVGDILPDIYNGVQPGNFGWLTWAGSPNEPTLMTSLTPPGNSGTYINPMNRRDHVVSIGDWVQGKPGISNSDRVRRALDTLKQIDIVVPVWDRAVGRGNKSLYRVAGFARVRITDYHLPRQNRITARFLGMVDCE